jgi:hypothetical protein
MYAMTRYDPELFPAEEAARFAGDLFRSRARPGPQEAAAIRAHILALYRRLLEDGREVADWRKPLLDFLARQPRFG